MFEGGEEVLETFIFDFDEDLYSRTIEIALVAFIRPEATFDSIDALVQRMSEDEADARRILQVSA